MNIHFLVCDTVVENWFGVDSCPRIGETVLLLGGKFRGVVKSVEWRRDIRIEKGFTLSSNGSRSESVKTHPYTIASVLLEEVKS